MHKIHNQLQQPQHGPVDVSSNPQGLRALFFSLVFALFWCSSLCLCKRFTFPLFYVPWPLFSTLFSSVLSSPVPDSCFLQLWPGLNSEDQMDWDAQITLVRQRWRCILENLTLFSFNSSDCSSSAIWRGCCLQLRVTGILLNITILPVPTEHLVCIASSSRGRKPSLQNWPGSPVRA